MAAVAAELADESCAAGEGAAEVEGELAAGVVTEFGGVIAAPKGRVGERGAAPRVNGSFPRAGRGGGRGAAGRAPFARAPARFFLWLPAAIDGP